MTPSNKANLMQLRRELISTLKHVEDALELPDDKRAVKSRVDRRKANQLEYKRIK